LPGEETAGASKGANSNVLATLVVDSDRMPESAAVDRLLDMPWTRRENVEWDTRPPAAQADGVGGISPHELAQRAAAANSSRELLSARRLARWLVATRLAVRLGDGLLPRHRSRSRSAWHSTRSSDAKDDDPNVS
jgi:hypothetical protein